MRPLDAVSQLLAGSQHAGRRLIPRRRLVDWPVLIGAQFSPYFLQALAKLQVFEHAVLFDGFRDDKEPFPLALIVVA